MKQRFQWFVVVGSGLSGKVKKDPYNAWWSYFLQGRRQFGYDLVADQEMSKAAHSPVLIMATTKAAANDADLSVTYGEFGNGKWKRVSDEDRDLLMAKYEYET